MTGTDDFGSGGRQVTDPADDLVIEELGECQHLGRHHVYSDFYETDRHTDHDGENVWVCVNCEKVIPR